MLAVAGIGGSTAPPEPLPAQALRNARLQVPYARQEESADGRLLLRVVTPVNSDDRLEPLKVLQVIEPVPKGLGQDVEKVRAGARDYQEISFSRQSLKRLYAVTLTLTLLLALTSALGLPSCCRSASPRRWGCSPRARARSRRAISRVGSP